MHIDGRYNWAHQQGVNLVNCRGLASECIIIMVWLKYACNQSKMIYIYIYILKARSPLFFTKWASLYFMKDVTKYGKIKIKLCPTRPWDEGGTSRFTVVSVTQRLCLCYISYSFSPMVFKFWDMVTMDKTLNWLTVRDLCSIFKVTGEGVTMFQN